MGVLDEILATKRDEVTRLRHPTTRKLLKSTALAAPPCRDFVRALRGNAASIGVAESGASSATLGLIAEIKRRSPSKGELAPDLDAAIIAKSYEAGNASCLSVLTDGPYFGGSMLDLDAARAATALPSLRKDFVIDEIQVYETRAVGADAMLLIVAALDDECLRDLLDAGIALGLSVLVETHDEHELERALQAGATIVGVNSRSLQTFDEDLGIAERLRSMIPDGVLAIAESSIRSVEDAQRMADAGFDAVLVGEGLVRSADPTATCVAMTNCKVRRHA